LGGQIAAPKPADLNAMCGSTLWAGGETQYVKNRFVAAQWAFRIPLTAVMNLYFDLSARWVFSLLIWEGLVTLPAFHCACSKGVGNAGCEGG
jgi:hypothetical protein